ncbi:NUDIX hydrolase [Paenibacillus sp. y28]|uniref:NUDIX hydrolase n=1 Tax=Paenibacillus sp. y28 TaxID=3129110 RepID=UPI003019AE98
MELIKEIGQSDIGLPAESTAGVRFRLRRASRAVVFNPDGQVALLYVSGDGYHKLPGGGIEDGEDMYGALHRELLEEAGVQIEVLSELGAIIEYHNEFELLQISYCFTCKVIGAQGEPSFTEEELTDGFQLKWTVLDEAIRLVETDCPASDSGRFIQARDLAFLKRAQERVQAAASSPLPIE